jgi:deoxyadenosine/deoxycytidine kinase
MKTATVTIGRNNKNPQIGPLWDSEWETFIDRVTAALRSFESKANGGDDTWTEIHLGTGTWNNIPEESAKITIFYTAEDSSREQKAINELKETLAILGNIFEQDAIALSLGTSELVSALSSFKVGA